MADVIFNGTTLTWDKDVYVDGTALTVGKKVYLDGTEVWKKHPYEPGSVVFRYSWSENGNINNFRTTYYNDYPAVFASQPTYQYGSGGADSRLNFTLADGFYVSYYHQDQGGNDTDGVGSSNTGGNYQIWVGVTVTGLVAFTYSLSVTGSGNDNSYFDISYAG